MRAELAANVRRLHSEGISCFPVRGKQPLLPWARFQTQLPTEAELAAWLSDPNIKGFGAATGRGLAVVDLDTDEAVAWGLETLLWSPWHVATHRGLHAYYRTETDVPNRVHLAGRALDVRGAGGFVVIAGSEHPSGGYYEGEYQGPRAELPLLPAELLEKPAPVSRGFRTTLLEARAQRDGLFAPASQDQKRRDTSGGSPASLPLRRLLAAKGPCPAMGAGSRAATLAAGVFALDELGLDMREAGRLLRLWVEASGHRVEEAPRDGAWDRRWLSVMATQAAVWLETRTAGGAR